MRSLRDGIVTREPTLAELLRDRPLVLVGMMGVGKTHVGRRLAARSGLAFVDSDDEVERAAGMSVADVFERFGERHFREREAAVVARLLGEGCRVVALGGGAFCHPGTRARAVTAAVTVWMRAPVAVAARRVGRGPRRPLLRGTDVEATLSRLSDERAAHYAQAHLHHDQSGDGDHAAGILAAVTAWMLAGEPSRPAERPHGEGDAVASSDAAATGWASQNACRAESAASGT